MKNKREKEIRSNIAITAPDNEESRVIHGVIPYNTKSCYMGFYEELDPACFKKTLAESKDIKALYQHNDDIPLARTKNGSLRFENTDTELRFEFDVPETSTGNDLLALVKAGIIDACSFGFICFRDEQKVEEGEVVRRVLEAKLIEVSPVTNPAYESTSIFCRSLSKSLEGKELDEDTQKLIVKEIEKLQAILNGEDPEEEHIDSNENEEQKSDPNSDPEKEDDSTPSTEPSEGEVAPHPEEDTLPSEEEEKSDPSPEEEEDLKALEDLAVKLQGIEEILNNRSIY